MLKLDVKHLLQSHAGLYYHQTIIVVSIRESSGNPNLARFFMLGAFANMAQLGNSVIQVGLDYENSAQTIYDAFDFTSFFSTHPGRK
jgi:hypothetical protein